MVTRGTWDPKVLGSIPGGALILPFDFSDVRPLFLSSSVSRGHDRLQYTTGVVITGLLKLLSNKRYIRDLEHILTDRMARTLLPDKLDRFPHLFAACYP